MMVSASIEHNEYISPQTASHLSSVISSLNATACCCLWRLLKKPHLLPWAECCLLTLQVTVIATSCRTILAGSLRVLLLLRPGNWKHAFGLLLLGAGLAGNNRWGTADGPPVRHRRIIDIGAILAPGLGRLRTLTMEQMERMGNVRGNSRGEPKP